MDFKFAFLGKAGSGKDYVARKIRKVYGESASVRYAFADKVKEDIVGILNIPQEEWSLLLHSEDYKNNRYVNLETLTLSARPILEKVLAHSSDNLGKDVGKYYMSLREFMVYYGTYVMRDKLGENIWINRLIGSPSFQKNLRNPRTLVTITDIRFPNEYSVCKRLGFEIIRVVNPSGSLGIDNIAESHIDSMIPDYTFYNYRDPDNFRESLKDFINHYNIRISR